MLTGHTVTIYSKDLTGKENKRTIKIEAVVKTDGKLFYQCFDLYTCRTFNADKDVYDRMFGHQAKPVKPPHFKGKNIGHGKMYN